MSLLLVRAERSLWKKRIVSAKEQEKSFPVSKKYQKIGEKNE